MSFFFGSKSVILGMIPFSTQKSMPLSNASQYKFHFKILILYFTVLGSHNDLFFSFFFWLFCLNSDQNGGVLQELWPV